MDEMVETVFGKLGEIYDGPHATPNRLDSGPYFLNIASLKSGRLDLDLSDHVSEEDYKHWTRRVAPEPGDLLFSYETRLGEAALMPEGVRACLGRRMALLRPNRSLVDPRFLLYFYLGPQFQRIIAQNAIHGATVPRIGLKTMPAWPVVVPPLTQQRAIAEVLGALDDKIAVNAVVSRKSRELSNAIFDQHARSGDSQELASMSALITRGIAPKYADSGLLVLNQKCVRNRSVDVAHARKTASPSRGLERILKKNDVLVNSTGQGTLGRAARWTLGEEATVDSHITIVRFDESIVDPVCGGFALLRLESQIESLAEGSTGQTELRKDLLGRLRIKVPPRECQGELGARLDEFDSLELSMAAESRKLAEARDELLPLLMSGKLRVKDAEQIVEEIA
ncbi:restriction endonuclease subunit S [Nocardia cyriacigeorgica]|uniref:restriction endonuclease subunit S n=1 Tax=Nocardia cyriacigeorgica TaxID=135487 RepID=UPI0024537A92|nr:restriction endonuclease subunit S [Nocardia cyriacigeorgica]